MLALQVRLGTAARLRLGVSHLHPARLSSRAARHPSAADQQGGEASQRALLARFSTSRPCSLQATEAYVEYDAAGRVIRGQEVKAKSR